MNKVDMLEVLLKTIKEHNITAYEIAKATQLSSVGVQKILNGETKKPNSTTLIKIFDYVEKNIVGTNLPLLNEVNEPSNSYLTVDEVAEYVIENEDELLKNKKFATWYNNILLNAENEFFKKYLNQK